MGPDGPGARSATLAVRDVVAWGSGRKVRVAARLAKKNRRQAMGVPSVERTESPWLNPAP